MVYIATAHASYRYKQYVHAYNRSVCGLPKAAISAEYLAEPLVLLAAFRRESIVAFIKVEGYSVWNPFYGTHLRLLNTHHVCYTKMQ